MTNVQQVKEDTGPASGLTVPDPVRLLIPAAIGAVIWFLPHPADITDEAWHMLAIFAATIVGIIIKPLPMGAVSFIAMVACIITSTVPISTKEAGAPYALMGFGNKTIWLIVVAFLIARGFVKTGFGRRIALLFVSKIGGKMLGVSYGLALADLVLSPAIPSATARGGGIMTPIMQSVAATYDSKPGPTARRAGAFLAINVGQVNAITCAMFLTAMAGNPLIASLAGDQGVNLTWTRWALCSIVPGLAALIIVPFVVYKVYPPELKDTPEVVGMAKQQLKEMGPVSAPEIVMAATFVLLLLLWTVGDIAFGLSATTAGFIGLVVLIVGGVLTWEDVIQEKSAWDTMIWFSVLYMMANALSSYGLIAWLTDGIATHLGGMNWVLALVILILVYFYSHYMFASATAHISAMYPAFLAVAIALGAPPMLAALVLAYMSNAFTSLTQYAGGASPAIFGTGFNSAGQWWRVSFIASLASLFCWIVIGGGWMKLIGMW